MRETRDSSGPLGRRIVDRPRKLRTGGSIRNRSKFFEVVALPLLASEIARQPRARELDQLVLVPRPEQDLPIAARGRNPVSLPRDGEGMDGVVMGELCDGMAGSSFTNDEIRGQAELGRIERPPLAAIAFATQAILTIRKKHPVLFVKHVNVVKQRYLLEFN